MADIAPSEDDIPDRELLDMLAAVRPDMLPMLVMLCMADMDMLGTLLNMLLYPLLLPNTVII